MTATTEQRVQLLQHLIDHRPITTAGPQVGLSPSEAYSVATDYGYPNRRRLTTALAELLTDTEEVAEAMAEQSDAELADADPELADTAEVRPELDPAPLELAAAEAGHGLGGARTLGQGVIATAEGPGEPGSVINWEGANYVPQDYALQLERTVAALRDQARIDQLDNGPAVATATDWSAWWVSRAAMLVEQGKASPVAATRKIAAKLDGLPGQLVAGIQADAADAERRAEVAKLRERLAELEGKPAKVMTAGGAPSTTYNAKAVRARARSNGIDVNPTGRVNADVVERWRAANPQVTA